MPRYWDQPGVLIEEIQAADRTIEGVATSTTAFIGGTVRGLTDKPRLVTSFADFERLFGSPSATFPLGHSVRLFFENGGRRALICRIRGERRGAPPTDDAISNPALEPQRRGIWLLDRVEDVVGIIVIPPLGSGIDVGRATWDAAAAYARRRRAMLIVDPPQAWREAADITPAALDALVTPGEHLVNAALYFPRILAPDPLAPSGAVAGIWARTDLNRGVWKAPAGPDGSLAGVTGLTAALTDADTDVLNPRGINTIRTFVGRGHVVWGARTLRGADVRPAEWKYVSVRRLFLYLESSIDQGIRWAVFEPNCEPLWVELRRHIGNFLTTTWRQGAFQGRTPDEAFFVRCDATTTTQNDIDNGRVNILIGVAPIRPAEFVLIRIEQRAGPPCP
jgi:uncharacterized protein